MPTSSFLYPHNAFLFKCVIVKTEIDRKARNIASQNEFSCFAIFCFTPPLSGSALFEQWQNCECYRITVVEQCQYQYLWNEKTVTRSAMQMQMVLQICKSFCSTGKRRPCACLITVCYHSTFDRSNVNAQFFNFMAIGTSHNLVCVCNLWVLYCCFCFVSLSLSIFLFLFSVILFIAHFHNIFFSLLRRVHCLFFAQINTYLFIRLRDYLDTILVLKLFIVSFVNDNPCTRIWMLNFWWQTWKIKTVKVLKGKSNCKWLSESMFATETWAKRKSPKKNRK